MTNNATIKSLHRLSRRHHSKLSHLLKLLSRKLLQTKRLKWALKTNKMIINSSLIKEISNRIISNKNMVFTTDSSNTPKGSLMTIESKEVISKMVASIVATTKPTIEISKMGLQIKEAFKREIRIGSRIHQSNNTNKIKARNQLSNAINKMNDRNGNEVKTITTETSNIPFSMKTMPMKIVIVGRIMGMVVGTAIVILATITNRVILMAKMRCSNTSINNTSRETISVTMMQEITVLPFTPPKTM